MIELERVKENPILVPNENVEWESKAVFNPGAVFYNHKTYLLYRAVGEYNTYISRIGLAISDDGINFKRELKPVIEPQKDYDKWACEDPRITEIDNTFYITYVALSQRIKEGGKPTYDIIHNLNSQTALITTKNFKDFQRHGIITPPNSDDRDVVIFPEKINKQFVILHRPHRWCKNWFKDSRSNTIDVNTPLPFDELPQRPAIWMSFSFDLEHWSNHKLLMHASHKNDEKIGPGAPPIRTDNGWLIFYHHVEKDKEKGIIYSAKVALLDLKDPSKIISKIPYPILFPKEKYEINGDVNNVVFPTTILKKGGDLLTYYGATDKYCGLATIKLDKLMKELLRHLI